MSSERIIDFMGKRHIAAVVSAVLLVLSVGSLAIKGLNLGLDFTGGTVVELQFVEAPDLQKVRETLAGSGYPGTNVVQFGSDTDLLIRMQNDSAAVDEHGEPVNVGRQMAESLAAAGYEGVTLMRSEIMGAQVGDELANDGGLGMLAALAAVFVYVALRFQMKFSVAALAALVHDVVIVLGLFSLLQLEFDLTVLAAVLAVVGYSLNDTIVVSDRIRENFRQMRETAPIDVINTSLSQTLGRTLMTSGTTMLVLLALFFFGGALIHNFSAALLVGVAVGTYSSMYVAAVILVLLSISKEDLMPPEKEGVELDELP